jgi:hypothetical protein
MIIFAIDARFWVVETGQKEQEGTTTEVECFFAPQYSYR